MMKKHAVSHKILKAFEDGLNRKNLSEAEFAKSAKISGTLLSLWKSGKRASPKNKEFYDQLEKVTGIDRDALIGELMISRFHPVPTNSGLSPAYWKGFWGEMEKSNFKFSSSAERRLWRIFANSYQADEFLPVLEDTLRKYCEAKGFKWISSKEDFEKLIRERKA